MDTPETVGQLVWYIFGGLASYFLWSIRTELTNIRDDLRTERAAREALALEITAMKAKCEERHRFGGP